MSTARMLARASTEKARPIGGLTPRRENAITTPPSMNPKPAGVKGMNMRRVTKGCRRKKARKDSSIPRALPRKYHWAPANNHPAKYIKRINIFRQTQI
jgi:hypothetical protein